jgi:hypothetical protein
MSIALLVGFLTAIGWWGGNKVTSAIDSVLETKQGCEVKKETSQ